MPPGLPGAEYYNLQGNFPRNRSVKDMKLISWNVNGIRACLDKGFLDFFRQEDADFFCIQETKMQPGQAEVDTPGYHQYWNSAERKGYSGTAVFAKREPVSVRYGLGIEEHDKEGPGHHSGVPGVLAGDCLHPQLPGGTGPAGLPLPVGGCVPGLSRTAQGPEAGDRLRRPQWWRTRRST